MEFDRLFSISAFEGLRLMRAAIAAVPEVTLESCPDALVAHSPQAKMYDLEAAKELHLLVATDAPHETVMFYRECILAVLILTMPAFAKLMTLERFLADLSRGDSHGRADLIHGAGWMEAGMDG